MPDRITAAEAAGESTEQKIARLERELARYQQAMPGDPILYAISKTDGSFLAVNKEDYDTLARAYAALKVERDELKAKLAACEKDAERYRWLREYSCRYDSLDAAIDALKENKPQGEQA